MRNNKFVLLLALVALASAVVALMKSLSLTRQLAGGPEPGNAAPNLSADADVDRVANAAERARMERYVNDLQTAKQVVTSFPSLTGETIDCVDVNGQPALKRPGMEGHVIQFAPTTLPQTRDQGASERRLQVPEQLYGLTGQRCPDRSVPMARLTMDTLKRFRTLDEFFQRKYIDIQKPTGGGSSSPHEWAHASRSIENWGGEAIFNVWSPYVEKSDEFSLAQMWITRGSNANLETVEGGWQVYRDLYGDWRAHLFIYFTPDNYGNGGCYNLSCTAFVQVNNSIFIG
jgi:hypothetical protein